MIAKLKKALEQKTCWEESVELISSAIVEIEALQARKAELNQGIIDRDSIIFKHVRRIEKLEDLLRRVEVTETWEDMKEEIEQALREKP